MPQSYQCVDLRKEEITDITEICADAMIQALTHYRNGSALPVISEIRIKCWTPTRIKVTIKIEDA